MNQHAPIQSNRADADYRLGHEPRLTLAVLINLGLSDSAIARFIKVTPEALRGLYKAHRLNPGQLRQVL